MEDVNIKLNWTPIKRRWIVIHFLLILPLFLPNLRQALFCTNRTARPPINSVAFLCAPARPPPSPPPGPEPKIPWKLWNSLPPQPLSASQPPAVSSFLPDNREEMLKKLWWWDCLRQYLKFCDSWSLACLQPTSSIKRQKTEKITFSLCVTMMAEGNPVTRVSNRYAEVQVWYSQATY